MTALCKTYGHITPNLNTSRNGSWLCSLEWQGSGKDQQTCITPAIRFKRGARLIKQGANVLLMKTVGSECDGRAGNGCEGSVTWISRKKRCLIFFFRGRLSLREESRKSPRVRISSRPEMPLCLGNSGKGKRPWPWSITDSSKRVWSLTSRWVRCKRKIAGSKYALRSDTCEGDKPEGRNEKD